MRYQGISFLLLHRLLLRWVKGKINQGGKQAESTNESFIQVANSSAEVGDIVGKIAVASEEQSTGIEEINKAISEVDKVIQENAASTEELSAQSEELQEFVNTLLDVTQGENRQEMAHKAPQKRIVNKTLKGNKDANDVFPLDEDDLKEF